MKNIEIPMDFNQIKLAVLGVGNWGKNHLKTAATLLPHENITVYDPGLRTKETVRAVSDKINIADSIDDIINNPEITTAIVATPAQTHYFVAKGMLESGKHVLAEKPITLYSKEAENLVHIAEKKNLRLMVGHVLLYHEAVKIIKNGVNKELGELQYLYSNRLNLGKIRFEENSLWSFAPHDIAIIQYIVGASPIAIHAKGSAVIQPHIEDSTVTYLKYPENTSAHIFVSWLHPFKEQRLVVIGTEGMYVFEDSLPKDKLKFYKKGFKNINGRFEAFDQSFEVVQYDHKPPLEEEQRHFFNCVLTGETPLSDGKHALEVLKILEQAQERLSE
ncbi:MAG: scyllo-inositol 2-dehydrogenase (NAD(+)) [Ignavibacteriaceae bacterium]|nr:scyllo-inositol 2-dehydrogenase (NAD(+)) [Ignavibacteriaceae bacterium]